MDSSFSIQPLGRFARPSEAVKRPKARASLSGFIIFNQSSIYPLSFRPYILTLAQTFVIDFLSRNSHVFHMTTSTSSTLVTDQ